MYLVRVLVVVYVYIVFGVTAHSLCIEYNGTFLYVSYIFVRPIRFNPVLFFWKI